MFTTACIHPPIKSKPRIKYKGSSVVHILGQTAHKHFLEQKSTSSSQETQNAIQWNTAFCRKHHVFKRFEGVVFKFVIKNPCGRIPPAQIHMKSLVPSMPILANNVSKQF